MKRCFVRQPSWMVALVFVLHTTASVAVQATATPLAPKYQNTSSTCSHAITIPVGLFNGVTTGINTQNVTCNYLYPSGTAWFRFIGTGDYVQADTCQYASSSHTVKISVHIGSCSSKNNNNNNLACIVASSSDSSLVCRNNQNSFVRWFAKLGQVYYIYVAARNYPPAPTKFVLRVSNKFTKAPTPAPTLPPCDVCGGKGLVTNLQAQVAVPGTGKVACADFLSRPTQPSTCASLQANITVRKTCGCQIFVKGGSECQFGQTIQLGQTIWGSRIGANFGEICQSHTTSASVWYRFVGTGGLVTIDTCRFADTPTYLIPMSGTCSIPLCFGYIGTSCGVSRYGVTVSYLTNKNQVYNVLVWGVDQDFPGLGNFALTLSERLQPLPTSSPTPAPKCFVCGDRQKHVTRPNSIVHVPSLGNVSCSQLQDFQDQNKLSSSTCSSLTAALVKTCGCQLYELPHTCQNAPTIRLGQVVYGSTVGAMAGPGNVNCILAYQSPGSWYRFIGNGMQVTSGAFPYSPIFTMSTYAFYGNCSALSCLNYNPTTWFAELGREYFIFATQNYFAMSVSAATLAPSQRPVKPTNKPSAPK